MARTIPKERRDSENLRKTALGLVEKQQHKPNVRIHSTNTLVPSSWNRKTGRAATLVESFYHATHGIWIGLKEERNVRIHFCAAMAVSAMGIWLKLDTISWLCLALSMGLVLTAEFVNTALEHLVDISASGEYHRSARYAKDTAAAAVLLAALVATVVGLLIFIPRLLAFFHLA